MYLVFKIVKSLMLNVWSCTYFPNATTQMRGQMESHLKELECVRDSLTAAEQKLQECQESLHHYKGKCADQAHTIRELQGQVSSHHSDFARCVKEMLWNDFTSWGHSCQGLIFFSPSCQLIKYQFYVDTVILFCKLF